MKLRKLFYLINILVLGLIIGCQDTKIIEVDLPYTEFTVVYGNMQADTSFEEVWITRTLPLNQTFNIEDASIPNAIAYFVLDGMNVIPLRFSGAGKYKPFNSIYPEAGQTYELFIEIDGNRFYAESKVPEPPTAGRVELIDNYISLDVNTRANESYGALWVYIDGRYITQADEIHSLIESPGDGSVVTVRTKIIPDDVMDSNSSDNLYIYLYAFDKDFARYFNSKAKNSSVDNALTQGGSPIFTNVSGENVIGAFTASAKSLIELN
ncbi:MAG: DUF4249 family protein [Bacteroidetes bacterium]|nr:DUF4249 family protein [Bacteroidota bacterium]